MRRNISNTAFIAVIMAVFIVGAVRTLFFPKDINYYENRYSEKIIKPTMSAIADNSFQNSIEDALADQIPKAQVMKKQYNTTNAKLLHALTRPILSLKDDIYVKYMGLTLFSGDHITYSQYDLSERSSQLRKKADNYNRIIAEYPHIQFYAYFIEKDTEINFETNEKNGSAEYMLSLLNIPNENKSAFIIDNYADFRRNFYRTDHHWNYAGSYKAYTELLTLLHVESPALKPSGEITLSDSFSGSKAASIGAMFTEDFTVYLFDYPKMNITINSEVSADYGMHDEVSRGVLPETVAYGTYYGGDSGEIIFDNGDGENILIIGESYDNAVLKLLASHFGRTYSVDLRNYEYFMHKPFEFDEYVRSNNIDKVLFIGNMDYYTLDDFLIGE